MSEHDILQELARLCRKLVGRVRPWPNDYFITEVYSNGEENWFLRDVENRIYLYRFVPNSSEHQQLLWINKRHDRFGTGGDYTLAACCQLLLALRKHMILEVLSDL